MTLDDDALAGEQFADYIRRWIDGKIDHIDYIRATMRHHEKLMRVPRKVKRATRKYILGELMTPKERRVVLRWLNARYRDIDANTSMLQTLDEHDWRYGPDQN